ncbi:MAG: lamin tail domain-containing protein [Leptospiraceae bacterium]|nr:lamin tail domain-containing protein [Leptospiraceae bacterium]
MQRLLTLILLMTVMQLNNCINITDPGFGRGNARLSIYYSDPGIDEFTATNKKIDLELVDIIDRAEKSVYLAVYNFNKQSIIDAILRAHLRNLDVRVIGDIDEFYTLGYQVMQQQRVNMILGNSSGIQHNKFAVVDEKYVFMGTGNLSSTDMDRNNNNWYIIESETMAKIYTDEFLQMYNGQFAAKKRPRSTNYTVTVNNYPIEIYFSPYHGQRAMNRLIELVNSAQKSIDYMIFAYTHDELAAAMVRAARQRNIMVRGTHDSTFINGVSQEAPRLFAAGYTNRYGVDPTRYTYGPFPKVDGNENTKIRNNPASGGKMHAKTIIIDAGTANAKMATGSFNWSNNAIVNNDENMVVFHDAFVANSIYRQFQETWDVGRDLEFRLNKNGHTVNSGDVIISEVHWAGSSKGSSVTAKDDFIEIFNNTAQPIDISHWGLQWGRNENYNIYPVPDSTNEYYENRQSCPGGFGEYTTRALPNIICPYQHRVFYALPTSAFAEPSQDEIVTFNQDDGIDRVVTPDSSLTTRHFRISGVKNFQLSNTEFKIRLYDKAMNLIDEAGDGNNAYAGALDSSGGSTQTRSKIRRSYTDNSNRMSGSLAAAWGTSTTNMNCSTTNDRWTSAPGGLNTCSNCSTYMQFDGCFDAAANTFATPGYENSTTQPPAVRQVILDSATSLRVLFNSNMSNCSTTGITVTGNASSVSGTFGTRTFALNTGFSTPGTKYSFSITSNCQDYLNTSISGTPLAFTVSGYSSSLAQVRLRKVVIDQGQAHDIPELNSSTSERRRYIRFEASSAGSLRNLRVLRYSSDGLEELHRFSDLYVMSGDSVIVSFSKPSHDQGANGTQTQKLASNHDIFDPTVNDTQGIPARPNPSGSSVFHVFSSATSLSGTGDVIILTYCGIDSASSAGCSLSNFGVQDVVYYTNRSGDVASGLMEGPIAHIQANLNSFWPIPEAPIDGLNDVTIQRSGVCTNNTPDGTGDCTCTSTARGIIRISDSAVGKTAWQCL